jgi:hypothetical protein
MPTSVACSKHTFDLTHQIKVPQFSNIVQPEGLTHHLPDCIWSVICLASLNVGCNRVSSTAALQALPALRMLALHSNAIAQPSAVLLLSSLASLQHLTLARNPVCEHSTWREATIAALPGLQVGAVRWVAALRALPSYALDAATSTADVGSAVALPPAAITTAAMHCVCKAHKLRACRTAHHLACYCKMSVRVLLACYRCLSTCNPEPLPPHQALDSSTITAEQRLAAQPHATDWTDAVAAGDLPYSSHGSQGTSSSRNSHSEGNCLEPGQLATTAVAQ